MKRTRPSVKVLAALLVAAAPASLAIAATTGLVAVPFVGASVGEASPYGGVVLEEFAASFDEPVTSGALDLRIDQGIVHVFGWEEDAYLVQVLQTADEQDLSDGETTITFNDAFTNGHLAIEVVVDHDRTYGLSADLEDRSLGDQAPQRAIVAWVPMAAAYESVFACSGQAGPFSDVGGTFDEVWGPLFGEDDEAEFPECVAQDATPSAALGVSMNEQHDDRINLTFGIEDLTGGELVLAGHYGDLVAHRATFEAATLLTYYGDISLEDADIEAFEAWTDYGDVAVEGSFGTMAVRTDYGDVDLTGEATTVDVATDYGDVALAGIVSAASITTDYGDVTLDIEPQRTGTFEIASNYGDVTVEVPKGPAYGYDVLAGTDYGDITLALENADVEEHAADDDERSWDDPASWFSTSQEREKQARAVTEGFEDRAIQVTMLIGTDYGNVLVTDGSVFAEEPDEDDESTDDVLAGLARPRPMLN